MRFYLLFNLEYLPWKLQLFLRRKFLIKFVHFLVLHIVTMRSLIHSCNTFKIPRNQLSAQEKGIILSLRQIMVAYPKLPCEGEPAFAVKINVTLKNTVK